MDFASISNRLPLIVDGEVLFNFNLYAKYHAVTAVVVAIRGLAPPKGLLQ